jgi:hypothetical protein
MQVTDIPRDYILSGSESDSSTAVTGRKVSLTGSLADIVGFSKEPIRLGKVAPTKEIKEAVIAIPYYKENNERKYFFFNDVVKQYVSYLKSDQSAKQSFAKLSEIPDSVINQIDLMQKYVLPPTVDFMKNDISNPFYMYIFEFSYTLSQQDLADIWQGLMPNIAMNFEEKSTSITHSLTTDDTQTQLSMKDKIANIQWLTFKVKYKAKNNYKAKLFQSIKTSNTKNTIKELQLTKTRNSLFTDINELDYSYNWPYDHFSMVEAAKITAQVDFIASDFIIDNQSEGKVSDSVVKTKNEEVSSPTAEQLKVQPDIQNAASLTNEQLTSIAVNNISIPQNTQTVSNVINSVTEQSVATLQQQTTITTQTIDTATNSLNTNNIVRINR